MTLAAVLDSPLATGGLSVINLHVTVFLARNLRTRVGRGSPLSHAGIALSGGGSTHSINRPCAVELTTRDAAVRLSPVHRFS
jgi:hypothetical protein